MMWPRSNPIHAVRRMLADRSRCGLPVLFKPSAALAFCFTVTTLSWAEDATVDYARDIKPLLRDKCFSCHSARKQEGGLRLDAAQLIRRGGESGAAIVARSAKTSLLFKRVSAGDEERMPPEDSGARLTADELSKLTVWIDSGAVAPDEAIPASPSDHWSFKPPTQPTPPRVAANWIRNDIDRFIAAEHQRIGVAAVGEASRAIWLRRVSLDLTGLPPTRPELQSFLGDSSTNAYEKAVDRLLASPRYGERWARHFMDIWRYSDPSGYGKEIRDGREHIWRWRDWIIDSLNAGKGYDRMVVEMLAADEAAPGDIDALRATGFLARNWYKFNRNVWLDNIVEHSSKAFLGLTVNCARCHAHKYDPIEHASYYQMRAIFETHDVRDDPLPGSQKLVRTFDAHLDRDTFLFMHGDENRPDKKRKLTPALPDVFGGTLKVSPVKLPVTVWYPALSESARAAAVKDAESKIAAAATALSRDKAGVEAARGQLAKFKSRNGPAPGNPSKAGSPASPPSTKLKSTGNEAVRTVLKDDFTKLNAAAWRIEAGTWTTNDGRLRQSNGQTKQLRLISVVDHPRDFKAKVKLRITGGDLYKSVGFGFDVNGQSMKAVYLSVSGNKVQFSSQGSNAVWSYPAAGMAAMPVKLGQDYTLELVIKDRLLNVLVDGKLAVAFNVAARNTGKFSIWTFSATADFDDLQLTDLPANYTFAAAGNVPTAAPKPLTPEDFAVALLIAEATEKKSASQLQTAKSELRSLNARLAAEMVKHGLLPGAHAELAKAAGQAERQLSEDRIHEQVAVSELQKSAAKRLVATAPKTKKAIADAEAKLQTLRKQLTDAKLAKPSSTYSPLGTTFPRTSSGRRLAFARWITSRQNPLAARVLVNHIWLRHFDAPLVERVFDFGLRSAKPRHADLLDWLSVTFMEDGWNLKDLHKRIVLSGVYRLSSSSIAAAPANLKNDSDNHWLWRMNVRRMDAEVVRDSVLYLGGSLDLKSGGPPIEHTSGQTVLRRSVYFRQDKERQMTFLSLFDGAKVNECYQRKATVSPQQALAMFNSRIASQQAGILTKRYVSLGSREYVNALFDHILCRAPTPEERNECTQFLSEFGSSPAARNQLALVLLNHNDFVTIR